MAQSAQLDGSISSQADITKDEVVGHILVEEPENPPVSGLRRSSRIHKEHEIFGAPAYWS